MAGQVIDLATRIYGLLDTRATYNGDQFIAEAARLIHEDRTAVREPLERRIAELEAERRNHLEAFASMTEQGAAGALIEFGHKLTWAERIALLEAQLATARDEALREAIAAIEKRRESVPFNETRKGYSGALGVIDALRDIAKRSSPPKSPWIPVEERLRSLLQELMADGFHRSLRARIKRELEAGTGA